jgi:hypothetical protein
MQPHAEMSGCLLHIPGSNRVQPESQERMEGWYVCGAPQTPLALGLANTKVTQTYPAAPGAYGRETAITTWCGDVGNKNCSIFVSYRDKK